MEPEVAKRLLEEAVGDVGAILVCDRPAIPRSLAPEKVREPRGHVPGRAPDEALPLPLRLPGVADARSDGSIPVAPRFVRSYSLTPTSS